MRSPPGPQGIVPCCGRGDTTQGVGKEGNGNECIFEVTSLDDTTS